MAKRIYFVAGEASGDEHGAALMRSLRDLAPNCEFFGRGGPRMKSIAGTTFVNWIADAAVIGLWEVVKHYPYFRKQFAAALDEIAAMKPEAVVLIDYPGFNLRLARTLRARSRQPEIIYYISPQVWAWNRGRIGKMARYLDLMLCIFPFEADLYNSSGLRTIFVGHPMIENLAGRRTGEPRDPNLVGLFPGSRSREVRKNFPVMLATAEKIAAGRSPVRFEVAAASQKIADELKGIVRNSSLRDRITIVTGDSTGAMQRCFAGMIASGTATLEATYFRLPFVLVYRVSWPTSLAARLLIRTKHVGISNILAGREIVPEFLQQNARPAAIAEAVLHLMNDPARRTQMLADFDAVIARLGDTGASKKAAREILAELS